MIANITTNVSFGNCSSLMVHNTSLPDWSGVATRVKAYAGRLEKNEWPFFDAHLNPELSIHTNQSDVSVQEFPLLTKAKQKSLKELSRLYVPEGYERYPQEYFCKYSADDRCYKLAFDFLTDIVNNAWKSANALWKKAFQGTPLPCNTNKGAQHEGFRNDWSDILRNVTQAIEKVGSIKNNEAQRNYTCHHIDEYSIHRLFEKDQRIQMQHWRKILEFIISKENIFHKNPFNSVCDVNGVTFEDPTIHSLEGAYSATLKISELLLLKQKFLVKCEDLCKKVDHSDSLLRKEMYIVELGLKEKIETNEIKFDSLWLFYVIGSIALILGAGGTGCFIKRCCSKRKSEESVTQNTETEICLEPFSTKTPEMNDIHLTIPLTDLEKILNGNPYI